MSVSGLGRQGMTRVTVNNTPYLVLTLVAQTSRLQYVLDDSDLHPLSR